MVGEPLPGWERAEIPRDKLVRYVLNPEHPRGRDKARVFRAVLGIGQEDADYLHDELVRALAEGRVSAMRPGYGGGTQYEVPLTIRGLNGVEQTVTSAWYFPPGSDAPRLVTLYMRV